MKLSIDRILTTHVGSLPRPQEVVDYLFAQDRGENYDPVKFDQAIRSGVLSALQKQVECRRRYRERRRDGQDQLCHLYPAPADRIRGRFGAADAAGS